MHRLYFAAALTSAALIAGFQPCAAYSDRDETMVRQAYAKLAFASRLGALHDSMSRPEFSDKSFDPQRFAKWVADMQVVFNLRNFRAGRLQDLLDSGVTLAEFVSKPSGTVMRIGTGTWSVDFAGKRSETFIATPKWDVAPYLTEDWTVPLADVVRQLQLNQYTRYVSFEVTARLQEQERTYKAAFLLSERNEVEVFDNVADRTAVMSALQASPEPSSLYTPLGRRKVVQEFIRSSKAPSNCETVDASSLCCDLATLTCGLTSAKQTLGQTVLPSTYTTTLPNII